MIGEEEDNFLVKIKHALPWLARYPFARANSILQSDSNLKKHIVIIVANHFEPSWKSDGGHCNIDEQRRRLDSWHESARAIGEAVRDTDGTKFRHTNFFPAEQYDRRLLEQLAAMQREGLGEAEIHLHHGVDAPDTAENLRKTLIEFRDCLAGEHRLLSRSESSDKPMYAFVHGNLALANSYGGRFCGVDNEMEILFDTGCYADMTLPNAPAPTQVSILNQIYECGLPLNQRAPHRKGKSVRVFGNPPRLPLIFTGPLIFNWTRGLLNPRIDDGALSANQPLDAARLRRWTSANITVKGRPDWVFVKLYCHGFFDQDQGNCIGENARRFFSEAVDRGEKSGEYKIHFASAREAFNMVAAAIDGKAGTPNDFRDYRLKAIMSERGAAAVVINK